MGKLLAAMHDLTNNKELFKALDVHVTKHGVGHLVGFKYGVLLEWLKGNRNETKRIDPENRRAMLFFLIMEDT